MFPTRCQSNYFTFCKYFLWRKETFGTPVQKSHINWLSYSRKKYLVRFSKNMDNYRSRNAFPWKLFFKGATTGNSRIKKFQLRIVNTLSYSFSKFLTNIFKEAEPYQSYTSVINLITKSNMNLMKLLLFTLNHFGYLLCLSRAEEKKLE